MNWQLVFNPFSKFNEKQLLLFGLIITGIGTLAGYYSNVSFNGVLDMHLINQTSLKRVLIENSINISTISITLFILGKILNAKTRTIDILSTGLWYRLPIYLVSLMSVFFLPKNLAESVSKNAGSPEKIFDQPLEILSLATFALGSLVFIAYSIVLLTNGFKTATNTKKWQHFVAFGFAILIAEAISHIIISKLC